MLTDAIAKIQAEMASSNNNPYILAVGGFMLQHLEANPEDAGKVLVKDKTLAKSLEAMRKAAEKKKVGNMAVLTDAEGFAIVLDYFKKEVAAPAAQPKPKSTKDSPAKAAPAKASEPEEAEESEDTGDADPEEDDIDFDALLM